MKGHLLRVGLIILAILAIAPLSLCKGGGGGSGGGGAGGGTSGGSHGSSYGGSSRSSYGGSSVSYGSGRSDNYYGGGRLDTSIEDKIVVACLSFLVMVVAGKAAKDRFFPDPPYQVGNWVLLLHNADRYTRTFERVARTRQFDTPQNRATAMYEIAASIDPADVAGGAYRLIETKADGLSLGSVAEDVYKTQTRQAEIRLGVERMHMPSETREFDDSANVLTPASSDSMCIFGLVLVSNRIREPGSGITGAEILASLRSSGAERHGPNSYMFLYYAPRPGESLAPARASRLFAKVTQDGAAERMVDELAIG